MVDGRQATSIDNPILNSPYAPPDRHYEVGQNGPTGVIKEGRRPSESWIPIAVAKKGKKGEPVQETIDFDLTTNTPGPSIPVGSFPFGIAITLRTVTSDVTPPTKPTNLATPVRGKTTMVLTWGASTDPDDSTLIYDIYVNDKKVGDTGGLRFEVKGLQCGTRYVFAVGARDKAGNVSGRIAKAETTLACATSPQ